MRIYVVEQYDYEESYVCGVYSTKEKAESAIKRFEQQDKKEGNKWQYALSSCVLDDN